MQTAVFAGGCFWCMESPFEELKGVKKVVSGYTGGKGDNPTYNDYTKKGHVEAVEITYDQTETTYRDLLNIFWMQIDPTDNEGQFCDRGSQYRPVIFYKNEEQKKEAEQSKKDLENTGKFSDHVLTEIIPASKFYPAEEYHQHYYKKNPIRYNFYRNSCGRDQFLNKLWIYDKIKSSKKNELKKRLNSLQYKVTQENGTEPPFDNEYYDNKKDGIYVDIVSGEVLFSSKDKYDSGTGWPSFTKPLETLNIIEKKENNILGARTEVRSKKADSHLGHVFNDGPGPLGLRYCMNSAALKFIPKEDLEKEGYGQYKKLFEI